MLEKMFQCLLGERVTIVFPWGHTVTSTAMVHEWERSEVLKSIRVDQDTIELSDVESITVNNGGAVIFSKVERA